ncbi:rcc01693 family protein [Pseudoruegeria sp. SK021]|uniref:rcc01693 family protein n=1 Tax=Pseudoruegeria sp. SK021 TaxID=1933035 RepID=UPI000A24DDAF|nr:rcc01693 family protein [Pseudoruegeria sp. SK021]OSP54340.1 hypothetical protein BV911_13295 [Pseudoruegeria sp. SK021]
MTEIDWPGLLRTGVQRVGLKPEEFWKLTPAELLLMLGAGQGEVPLSRAQLEQLASRFPDTVKGV